MWTVSQVIGMALLACLAILDLRFRQVPARLLAAATVAAGVYQLITRDLDFLLIAEGMLAGAVFFGISKVTREALGYGDSWVILILGIYLGLWKLLEVLSAAFFLLALCSVGCLLWKKMSKRCTLPFLPFLAAGYLIAVGTGGTL